MKRKLTYCLLAILLLPLGLHAESCEMDIKGYHGGYAFPYMQQTMEFIVKNPTTTLIPVFPSIPDPSLTVYKIDPGRTDPNSQASSTAALFSYIPSPDNPILAVRFAVEFDYGSGGHEPVFGYIRAYDAEMSLISCGYSYSLAVGEDRSQYIRYSSSMFYRPWDVMFLDLSNYIGQKITIEIVANTCSTLNCTGIIYTAFDCSINDLCQERSICAECDSVTLEVPSIFSTYEWHKGAPDGPIVGQNEPLKLKKWEFANYYCVINGYCGSIMIPYVVNDVHTLFDTDVHCGEKEDTVYLTNNSYIQHQSITYTKTPCEGALWDFGDGRTSTDPNLPYIVYTEGGEYTISLKAGNADLSCAQTVSKTLTVCPPEPSKDSIPLNPMPLIPVTDSIDSVVCFGTKVEWREQILTETGIYRDTTLSVIWGVDSIYHILNLHVSDEPVEELLKDTSSCAIIPFMWHGHLIESDTLLLDTIRTVQLGCDSIYSSLRFTLKAPTGSDTTAYICNNDLPFIWHGKEATDGDTVILINTAGCDSIVTLHLTVYQSGTWEDTQTICDKQLPFLWKDKTCTEAGDYVFDTLTTHGCDSTITLHLIVSDHAEADTVAYVCYQDLPFIWHGKEAVDGDTVILTNTVGCDSIVTLRLTISAPMTTQTVDTTVCDTLLPYTWRGHTFPVVGEFRDTLRNAHGCDSLEFIYTLDTFHCERPLPPPVDSCLDSLVYRKWQDVLFCDNGRHEFVAYQWFRDNISLAGETNQYLYSPGGFGTNEYFVEVTYAGGKKRCTCPLSFDDTPRSADTYARVQTLVRRGERLHIEISDQSAEVDILTILGQQLSHFSIGKTADLDVQLPSGVYVLILKGEQVKRTTKIMVE